MSGAPYGDRYVRKTDEAPAAYAVLEADARVVERIYEMYTVEGPSIGEITRRINAEGMPTRKASARWERSTVRAVSVTLRIMVSPVSVRPAPLRGPASSAASAGCGYAQHHSRPREFRPCPGTPSGEQNTVAPSNHRAKYRAGAGQLSEVRLRLLAKSTTTNVLVPIAGENWVAWFATTAALSVRICSIRSSGPKSFDYWKTPH
jgi:hypothetical protein